jgi:hypothetical protein
VNIRFGEMSGNDSQAADALLTKGKAAFKKKS